MAHMDVPLAIRNLLIIKLDLLVESVTVKNDRAAHQTCLEAIRDSLDIVDPFLLEDNGSLLFLDLSEHERQRLHQEDMFDPNSVANLSLFGAAGGFLHLQLLLFYYVPLKQQELLVLELLLLDLLFVVGDL
jgi:hypothetical protein